jgi:hypothetical protein
LHRPGFTIEKGAIVRAGEFTIFDGSTLLTTGKLRAGKLSTGAADSQ